eukprot:1152100-Pelagomonas_calceolata.AAC.5
MQAWNLQANKKKGRRGQAVGAFTECCPCIPYLVRRGVLALKKIQWKALSARYACMAPEHGAQDMLHTN